MNETVEALVETREQLIASCNATALAYVLKTGKRLVISPGVAAAFRDGGLDMTLFEIDSPMLRDAANYGVGIELDGKRVAPEDFYK